MPFGPHVQTQAWYSWEDSVYPPLLEKLTLVDTAWPTLRALVQLANLTDLHIDNPMYVRSHH